MATPNTHGRTPCALRCVAAWLLLAGIEASGAAARDLSIEDRVDAQRAIEQVLWNHRTWPGENHRPKPSLDAVLTDDDLRAKVEEYLRKSNALDLWWGQPITGEQLQREMERMAKDTRDAGMLLEIFAALDDDPFLIAETLARETLSDRLIRDRYAHDDPVRDLRPFENEEPGSFDAWWDAVRETVDAEPAVSEDDYSAVVPEAGGCIADTWQSTAAGVPISYNTAVWTGTEMIVWGGRVDSGGRYRPATDSWVLTPRTANVPSPRSYHTAVWTGTEMIVWGGENGGTYFNTGGRYNPTTDSWTATSGTGVPGARSGHTAVWTGTEMIVWGGTGGTGGPQLNTGGRYNPVTNSWSATSTGLNVPEARIQHSAVWTGTEIIVWGGNHYEAYKDNGGRYNPVTNSWSTVATGANVPAPRGRHTAIWTGTTMIIWGGWGGVGVNPFNSGGRYNPATNSWATTSMGANVPELRHQHTAVWTGTEMIVWGGVGTGMPVLGGRYNPVADTWSPTSTGANTPAGRYGHTAVWTGTEMIIWGGGWEPGGRYIPATNTWAPMAFGTGATLARTSPRAVWTGTEMIVWGGYGSGVDKTGGRYLPATDSWSATSTGANTPDGRYDHTAIWTGTEMIVWGGITSITVNTGGRYNPATNSWQATSTGTGVPALRSAHSAVWTGSEMIVWGGTGGSVLNTGARYNPVTNSWVATSTGANTPAARQAHTAVWNGTDMIVWGGAGSVDLNTGGRYRPSTNTWLTTSTGANLPVPRRSHTAVWTGTEMIVWGGAGYLQTGGRYQPANDSWLATSTVGVPTGRLGHTAVWTGTEMIIWGGRDIAAYVDSGGRYDPGRDTWLATSRGMNVPTGRTLHAAVWTGSEMIVWGGSETGRPARTGGRYCTGGCTSPDMWYQDGDSDGFGLTSTQQSTCTPPAGYVTVPGDCNDASAGVWSAPIEVTNLVLGGGATTTLAWDEQGTQVGPAVTYDVARGSLGTWPVGSGGGSCVGRALQGTTMSDAGVPASGSGFWYLARGHNTCAAGTYGFQSNGVARTSGNCP